MSLKQRFWWVAAAFCLLALIALSGLAVALGHQMDPTRVRVVADIVRAYPWYLVAGAVALGVIALLAVEAIWRNIIAPVNQLVVETALIQTVNPSHRIRIQGSDDLQRLAAAINVLAETCQQGQELVDERICQAKAETESEKNILAAIVAELPVGILICNTDGQILLYNPLALKLLIGGQADVAGPDGLVGLGRSVFGVIERESIAYAIETVSQRLSSNSTDVVVPFAVQSRNGSLIRVEAVPVLDHRRQFNGLILLLNDISHDLENDLEQSRRQRDQTRKIRDALAGVRAAIETILAYPSMAEDQRDRFYRIIHQQAIKLERVATADQDGDPRRLLTRWPRLPMPFADLALSLTQRAREKLGIVLRPAGQGDGQGWVHVENHSMGLTLLFLLQRLHQETGSDHFDYTFECKTPLGAFDLIWTGRPVPMETVKQWAESPLAVAGQQLDLAPAQILAFHGSEFWSGSLGSDSQRAFLRVLLPVSTASMENQAVRHPAILPQSRPEFYDFDLFNQRGQVADLALSALAELSYTVFDTETTGLDPRQDEIISIGAVRIVNGRLLHDEIFDQLVDPRRIVPAASTRFHGITGEMLLGQPTIETVLVRFAQFGADTVLVGHNVAFDMRMLQMKEKSSGVTLLNPVLDTLLLSAVIHPTQTDHSMETLARLLGVNIVGRHTALGDAMVTGEIFLRMIPLLARNGIFTLREALAASRKTYYARLKY